MAFGKIANGLFAHVCILMVLGLASCSGGAGPAGNAIPGSAQQPQSTQGVAATGPSLSPPALSSVSAVEASPSGAPALTARVQQPQAAAMRGPARQASGSPTTIFQDNFQEQNLNQWTVAGGTFAICRPASGYAACAGTSPNNAMFAGTASWTDYTMQAAITLNSIGSSREGVDVVVRAQDSSHFYELELVKETDGSQQWEMWRDAGGQWTNLARGYTPFVTGGDYLLRLQVQGSAITASLSRDNGTTFAVLGSANDSAYASGMIGLRAWGGMAGSFTNVLVTTQSAPPTPQPSQSPSGKLGDVYNGCQLWPKNDFWNLDITNAPVDSSSAAIIAKANSATGGATFATIYQSQILNSLPYNAPTATMHQTVSYHRFPQAWPIGPAGAQSPPVPISAGGDANLLIVQAAGAGNPCMLWQAGDTIYSQSAGYASYNGAGWTLNEAMPVRPDFCAAQLCADGGSTGIAQRAFHVRVQEVIAGSIAHALDGEFPMGALCGGEFLYPAYSSAQGNASWPCLPGASKVRLKASFSENGLSADAVTVVQGLKHFGMAVVDNGCCFGTLWGQKLSTDSRNIDVSGINAALNKIRVTDFDVIQLGPLNGARYTYPGIPGP